MYHVVVEALLAQPGQHFISDYLEQARAAARLPRGHAPGGAGRAAPHRLRRQAALRPARRAGRDRRRRGPDPPRDAVLARGLHPAQLGPLLHRVLRLHARGDLHRGRALLRAEAALGGHAAGVAPRPVGLPAGDEPARARGVRPGDAAGRLHRPAERRAAARPGVAGAADDLGRARDRHPHRAGRPVHRPVGVRRRRAVARARRQRLDRRGRRARRARRPRAALPLRGLRRRRRRPPGPAPRGGHGQAAPARLAARAVGRAYARSGDREAVCASCSSRPASTSSARAPPTSRRRGTVWAQRGR